jgi:hypothetical protein
VNHRLIRGDKGELVVRLLHTKNRRENEETGSLKVPNIFIYPLLRQLQAVPFSFLTGITGPFANQLSSL